jgi:hypothetical protein
MADQLCTPTDLAGFLDQDVITAKAEIVIEAATAVVQSLVDERIVGAYPADSQEWQLAHVAALSLAAAVYVRPQALDYEKAYKIAAVAMDQSPHWRAALRLQYDRRIALIGADGVQ